ncbi:MAG: hypothetical protein ACPGR7_07140 [Flavobacteriaceae bacterium]
MFSKGQIIFGICFAIAFIGLMIYSYSKDKKLHQTHYKKGAIKAGIWIAIVLTFFFLIRFMSH